MDSFEIRLVWLGGATENGKLFHRCAICGTQCIRYFVGRAGQSNNLLVNTDSYAAVLCGLDVGTVMAFNVVSLVLHTK